MKSNELPKGFFCHTTKYFDNREMKFGWKGMSRNTVTPTLLSFISKPTDTPKRLSLRDLRTTFRSFPPSLPLQGQGPSP